MMQTVRWTRCLGSLLGALWASGALAAPAHHHGVAELEVVQDKQTLAMTLHVPLPDMLGFERAPRNEAERKAVRHMAERWRSGLVLPAPEAGCRLLQMRLSSPVLSPALLGEGNAAAPASAAVKHAELTVDYRFDCLYPQAFKSVQLGVFEAFASIRSINARLVTDAGQRAELLKPRSPEWRW